MGSLPLIILSVVFGSLLLAISSVTHYRHKIRKLVNYSVFLIREPGSFDLLLLERLYDVCKNTGFSFALEKLYRSNKQALVIYAPSFLVRPLSLPLKLLEIEDYSQSLMQSDLTLPTTNILAFQLESRGFQSNLTLLAQEYAKELNLEEGEQVWWQWVLRPKSQPSIIDQGMEIIKRISDQKSIVDANPESGFYFNLRLIIQTSNQTKALVLYRKLNQVSDSLGIHFLPQVHSKFQITNFYRDRLLILESAIKSFYRKVFYPEDSFQKVTYSILLKSTSVVGLSQLLRLIDNPGS